MAHRYEDGLEVAPVQADQPGLELHEHYNRQDEKMPLSPNGPPPPPEKNGIHGPQAYGELPQKQDAQYSGGAYNGAAYHDHTGGTSSATAYASEKPQKNRICGLRRRTFWCIIAAVALIIIAAVVGGVVGGLKSNDSNDANSSAVPDSGASSSSKAQSTAHATAAASATTTEKAITTTTLLTEPSATYLSDCPSANGTIYKVKQGAKTLNYRILCGAAIFNVDDPKAAINTNQNSLENCIQQCGLNVPQGQTCNAVCWRNRRNPNDQAAIGSCFGYKTTNTTQNTFSGTLRNSYCDGAVFIGAGKNWSDEF